jgi:hypothetical protein
MAGKKISRSAKTPEMWAIATTLLEIAPNEKYLSLPETTHKSAYIPLSNQIGRSRSHKNAVNVHPGFVSFMVPDWGLKVSVEASGLSCEKNERYGFRLHVCIVEAHQVHSRKEIFTKLLETAKQTSTDRQISQAH